MISWKINSTRNIEEVESSETLDSKEFAKVKVTRAGVCAGDIALYNSNPATPLSPCRIAVGLISESNDITLKKGQRVMLSPYSKGVNDSIKIHGQNIDGYLSDYCNVALGDIYTMPEGMTDEAITFIEDIALTIAMHEKLNIQKTQYVLIYGASAINLIFAQLCVYYQAIPIIVDDDSARLEMASDMGIYYQIDLSQEDLTDKLKEITSGKMADYLVIDTDAFASVGNVLYNLAQDGKVGLYGFNPSLGNLQGDFSPIITHNLTVYGLDNGYGELETAVNMLATEIVKVDNLVDSVADISQTKELFEELSYKPMYYKTVIRC